MDYYINSEVAKEFNVSNTTVSRWIEGAMEKKNNLEIVLINNKHRILKNPNNSAELIRLQEEGIKYRNASNISIIDPKEEFYSIFSEEEIFEIINKIQLNKEIPNKFTFKNGGAKIWDNYYLTNAINGAYPTPNRVINLLSSSFDYLLYRISNYKSVNIIDVGQGNSWPVKAFLEKLNKTGKLKRYIAIDVGKEMNEISKQNINNWFPGLEFKSYVADIEKTYFGRIFTENKDDLDEEENINIVLYLGSMIGMHDDKTQVLKNFRDGLGSNDLLIISNTIDSNSNKVDFSYVKNPEGDRQNVWIPEIIGIDVKNCELVSKFDGHRNQRELNLKLDKDYILNVKIFGKTKTLRLYKDSEINIWKHKMSQVSELIDDLEDARLRVVNLAIELDYSHVLVACEAFRS